MLSADNLINIFNEYRQWAIIISLSISILISLVGILPSIFITCANIIFFGPTAGFTISLIGETIGGYITLKIYRLGLKSTSEKIKGKFPLLDKLLISEGIQAGIIIFEGRIIPFMPSGFVTLAASLSKVNDYIFILATLMGKIPSIALETLISIDLINIQENYLRLFLTIITLFLILIINKIFLKSKTKNKFIK